jgi:hypothetical protein
MAPRPDRLRQPFAVQAQEQAPCSERSGTLRGG